MFRISYQFLIMSFTVLSLCGCPLLNPILDAPESAFEASPTTGQAPLTVLFADTSAAGTTNITDWQWDFGDGLTSTLRNPSHIYEMPGLYTVSLTVTTSVGTHTVVRQDYINVVQPPTAEFSAMPEIGNAPLEVTFSDMSEPGSSDITAWQWNFGDRTPTSGEQNPVHVYDEPGLYTVSLTVTTDVDSDTVEKVQFINVAGNPMADFEADFEPGTAPLTVEFTDTSDAGTAEITGWMWDFGDGGMAMEQNPTYTYETPGVYTVSLTIETEVGEDTVVREGLIDVGEGPVAMFSGDPVMGLAPLTVAFADESSAGSMAISRWLWDFGDGGLLSTRQNPTRVYNRPGVYTVSLRVTTPIGDNTSEQEDFITVLPGVAFTGNRTEGQGSLTVQFVDQSPVGDFEISAWAWDFGDGGMSTERNPEHTYTEPGVYDVSLTITTDLGDSMTTETGYITVTPTTAFSADPVTGAPPLEVTFTDETVAGSFEISAWAWDFGDGGTSTEESPAYTYETPGVYTVSLETTTEAGATSAVRPALVQVEPIVAIGADSTEGQGTLTVNFEDQTDAGNLNILSWFWDFGDGMSSTQRNPSHTYQNIGTYTVSLRVTTALGDTTHVETDLINVGPVVDFTSDVESGVGTLPVQFTSAIQAGSLEVMGLMWEFGDGNTSEEANPAHEYAMPGIYTVALTVTTGQGDTTTSKADFIRVEPMVAIDFVQAEGPAPFEASLLDITVPLPDGNPFKPTAWEWNLGDGNTSSDQNPVHTYEDPGTYTVTLTITTDGGEFSVTEPDFIRALRGPTAAFSQNVSPGGDPDDPVTVSFVNMSTPGDAPILNQTWDFGASAQFDEGVDEEENPTVMYPGPDFATVPQDVSLTVRTMIAEDTLLKENLFNAPLSKSTVDAATLATAEFSAIATNERGDVWAAGRLRAPDGPDAVVVRFSPTGSVRWAHGLASEGALTVTGLALGTGDALALVATLSGPDADAVYLAGFHGTGDTLWEDTIYGDPAFRSTGAIATVAGDQFAALCVGENTPAGRRLYVLRGDFAGSALTLLGGDQSVPREPTNAAAIGLDTVLVSGLGAEPVTLRWPADVVSLDAKQTGPVLPTGAMHWDGERRGLDQTVFMDGAWAVESGGAAIPLPDTLATPHAIQVPQGNPESGEVVWLAREKGRVDWKVRRFAYPR